MNVMRLHVRVQMYTLIHTYTLSLLLVMVCVCVLYSVYCDTIIVELRPPSHTHLAMLRASCFAMTSSSSFDTSNIE